MRLINAIALVFCSLATLVYGQGELTNRNALKEGLINLEKQSWEARQKRDGKFFEKFLSEDHVEAGFRGFTNKAAVVASVVSPNCIVKSYALEGLVLRLKHFNPGLIGWEEKAQVHNYPLTTYQKGLAIFERSDKKLRLTFRRTSEDTLSVVLDQTTEGKENSEEFKFRLIKGS